MLFIVSVEDCPDITTIGFAVMMLWMVLRFVSPVVDVNCILDVCFLL